MRNPALHAAAGLLACWMLAGAANAAPPIESYGRLPSVELMRLSPSGERYAFVAVVGESRKLVAATFDNKLLQATAVGDNKVIQVQWADDGHLLLTTHSTFNDPVGFYRPYDLDSMIDIHLDNHTVTTIYKGVDSVAQTVVGYFGSGSAEGRPIGYFGGFTFDKGKLGDYYFPEGEVFRDLYQVDLDTGRTALLAKGEDRDHDWVVAPDGGIVAHSEYDDQSGEWRLYAGKGRDQLLFTRTSPTDDIVLMGAGRSPGTVLVVDSSGIEDVAEEVTVADGKRERLFGSVSVGEFLFDPADGRLIGALTAEQPGAVFFDAALQQRYEATRKAFPGYQMHLVSYSRNLNRLIVLTDGGDDSGTYWMVDIASGKANVLGQRYPAIKPADVGPTRMVKYAAADGTALEGVLTLPPGVKTEKLPLVVMPHGGPFGAHDEIGFDWWAQAFAAAGYAVFQPNFRGSSGYGRDFRQAGFGQWGGKMLTDISDGIGPLAAQGLVDPKRVCIVGASYGGYAALAGVTLQQGIYRCSVSFAGIADLTGWLNWLTSNRRGDSSLARYVRAATGAKGSGSEVEAALNAISPLSFAARADAPILLIHGLDDLRVPADQSQAMAAALKRAHKPYELLTLKSEDHFLSREETRVAMLKAAVDFVKRNNPPDQDAAAAPPQ